MGNANPKCQDAKKNSEYINNEGNDAKQFAGVIDAALKANFDFQGHPSDFRAADSNEDNFLDSAELKSILSAQGSSNATDSQVSAAIKLYDGTAARVDTKFANGDGDGRMHINEYVNCGGFKSADEAADAAINASICPCDIPKCPDVTVPACPAAPACNVDVSAVLDAIAALSQKVDNAVETITGKVDGAVNTINNNTDNAISSAETSIKGSVSDAVTTIQTNTDASISQSEQNIIAEIDAAETNITNITGAQIDGAAKDINANVDDIEELDIVATFTRNPDVTCSAAAERVHYDSQEGATDYNNTDVNENFDGNEFVEDELDMLSADAAAEAAFADDAIDA